MTQFNYGPVGQTYEEDEGDNPRRRRAHVLDHLGRLRGGRQALRASRSITAVSGITPSIRPDRDAQGLQLGRLARRGRSARRPPSGRAPFDERPRPLRPRCLHPRGHHPPRSPSRCGRPSDTPPTVGTSNTFRSPCGLKYNAAPPSRLGRHDDGRPPRPLRTPATSCTARSAVSCRRLRWVFHSTSTLTGDNLFVATPDATAYASAGRWLRKTGYVDLAMAIAHGTADAAVLATLPTGASSCRAATGRSPRASRAAARRPSASTPRSRVTTAGDVLGGSGGDVTALLPGPLGIKEATIGADVAAGMVLRAAETIKFNRITNGFTAGAGYARVVGFLVNPAPDRRTAPATHTPRARRSRHGASSRHRPDSRSAPEPPDGTP